MRRRWQVSSANADININCYWIERAFYIAFLYATQTNQWHLPRSPNWEELKSSALQTIKWTLSYQNNLSGGCSGSKHENLRSEPDNWSSHTFINEEVIQSPHCFSVDKRKYKTRLLPISFTLNHWKGSF